MEILFEHINRDDFNFNPNELRELSNLKNSIDNIFKNNNLENMQNYFNNRVYKILDKTQRGGMMATRKQERPNQKVPIPSAPSMDDFLGNAGGGIVLPDARIPLYQQQLAEPSAPSIEQMFQRNEGGGVLPNAPSAPPIYQMFQENESVSTEQTPRKKHKTLSNPTRIDLPRATYDPNQSQYEEPLLPVPDYIHYNTNNPIKLTYVLPLFMLISLCIGMATNIDNTSMQQNLGKAVGGMIIPFIMALKDDVIDPLKQKYENKQKTLQSYNENVNATLQNEEIRRRNDIIRNGPVETTATIVEQFEGLVSAIPIDTMNATIDANESDILRMADEIHAQIDRFETKIEREHKTFHGLRTNRIQRYTDERNLYVDRLREIENYLRRYIHNPLNASMAPPTAHVSICEEECQENVDEFIEAAKDANLNEEEGSELFGEFGLVIYSVANYVKGFFYGGKHNKSRKTKTTIKKTKRSNKYKKNKRTKRSNKNKYTKRSKK
jgi:hypothetical protein